MQILVIGRTVFLLIITKSQFYILRIQIYFQGRHMASACMFCGQHRRRRSQTGPIIFLYMEVFANYPDQIHTSTGHIMFFLIWKYLPNIYTKCISSSKPLCFLSYKSICRISRLKNTSIESPMFLFIRKYLPNVFKIRTFF